MRYTITPTLLNSWLYMSSDFEKYVFDTSDKTAEDYERAAYDDFVATLRRVPSITTEAMQKGIDFENLVVGICEGQDHTGHKWYEAANEVAQEVMGAQFQVAATKDIEVAGWPIQLKGRMDCLKAGTVTDIKFGSRYEVGKYFTSAQHPIYMALEPEASLFVYLISNGSKVWREKYTRPECRPVGELIIAFLEYLKNANLLQIYKEMWVVK